METPMLYFRLAKSFCLLPLFASLIAGLVIGCDAKVNSSDTTSSSTTDSSKQDSSSQSSKSPADSKKSDNTKEIEKSAPQSLNPLLIDEGIKSPVQSVSCPEVDPIKTGKVIDCEATIKEGTFPVTVTFKDEKGNINLKLNRLIALSKAEKLIQEKLNVEATADCGGTVWIIKKVGESFTCKATEKAGKTHDVKVTVADESGKVELSIDPS
jgi:hypothetical protein